jgi:hypothetical protein
MTSAPTANQATPPGATSRPREPVEKLASVEYDRARSTPFDEVYRAKSDTTIGTVYAVCHHVETDRWSCECVGASYGRECRHVRRCKRLRKVQYFHALFLGWGPADLRAQRAVYEARVALGWATEDDWAGLDAIQLLTQYGDRSAA